MMDLFGPEAFAVFWAFVQVVIIDLSLAADNAVAVGMAAAGLPSQQRVRAIVFGMSGAAILLVILALITTQLLQLVGLKLVGGLLLLWVCWKMWCELREESEGVEEGMEALTGEDTNGDGVIAGRTPRKTLGQAALQIIIADLSMSVDNVLAVAGAAREHPKVLIFGLVLSIFTMGVAATFIAKLLATYHWIAYIGLIIILYVAVNMVYMGVLDVKPYLMAAV